MGRVVLDHLEMERIGMSSGKGNNRVNLTERDLGAVELVKDYGMLTTSQIQRLLYPTLQKAQTRLLRLFKAGMVQRFAYPVLPWEGGKGEYVYHLKSRPRTALSLLRHTLKLNDVRIAFELACRKKNGQVNLVEFIPEYKGVKGRRNDQKPVRATEDTVGVRNGTGGEILIPDAVLCLENPATKKRALFFLEVDLGSEKLISTTPGHYSLLKKIMLYKKYFNNRGYDRYAKTFDYDFKGFRVLTVMDSKTRISRLRTALAETRIQGFAWFTDTATIKGADVLGKIWLMTDPNDKNKYSIISN